MDAVCLCYSQMLDKILNEVKMLHIYNMYCIDTLHKITQYSLLVFCKSKFFIKNVSYF